MAIYAIVVTHNGSKWIEKCITCLLNSSVKLEIIAVDNDSNDGTGEIIKQKFHSIDLINLKQNMGFGMANNIGIKKALRNGADYIFLINQDAFVEKSAVEILRNTISENPEYGIISPMQLNGTGNDIDLYFESYLHEITEQSFLSDLFFKKLKGLYNLNFAPAAAWLISRVCLIKTGGFDPLFFHYGEDSDYVNRVHYNKLKLGMVPSAFVYHDRICRPIDELFNDVKRRALSMIVGLKDINKPFFLCLVIFIKSELKEIYRSLFKKDMKQFKVELESILITCRQIPRIIKARAKSKKPNAFLSSIKDF